MRGSAFDPPGAVSRLLHASPSTEAPGSTRVRRASRQRSRALGVSLGPQPRSRATRRPGDARARMWQDHGSILLNWRAAACGAILLHRRVMACALGVALAGLAVGVLVSPLHSTMYDTDVMMQVTQNLLTKASFQVPSDGFNGPYSTYGLGMSLVFIVPYLLASLVHGDVVSWMLLSGPVLFALTLVAVFWLAIGCGATRRQG